MAQTPAEFSKKLDRVFKRISDRKFQEPCFRAIHNAISIRVFTKGLDKNNTHFKPSYSTEKAYFSDKGMPRKFKGGNSGKTGKKTKTTWYEGGSLQIPYKTKYFSGGYKQLRADQGVQTAFVDLNLTGNLSRDFASSFRRQESGWSSGVKKDESIKKISGAITKYGPKIFQASKLNLSTLSKCLGVKVISAYDGGNNN